MVRDYKKMDLFGKTFIQKVDLISPLEYVVAVAQQACFLYMLNGEMQYQLDDDRVNIPTHHSLLLNCAHSGREIHQSDAGRNGEVVIVTFHPDILKRVYQK